VARVSAKRRILLAKRRALRDALLALYPVCERCNREPSVDGHEPQKRSRNPRAWLDLAMVVALCRGCHDWTEREPRAATEAGWLLPSWLTDDEARAAVATLRERRTA
jgi:5-methylcytosine-specific restriction endonuclease McrA